MRLRSRRTQGRAEPTQPAENTPAADRPAWVRPQIHWLAADSRPLRRWPVRAHLAVALVVVGLAMAAALAYGYYRSSQQARAAAQQELELRSRLATDELNSELRAIGSSLAALTQQDGVAAALDQPAGCTLTAEGGQLLRSVRLDIVRRDGLVGCSSRPTPALLARPGPHADSEWLTEALQAQGPLTQWFTVDPPTAEPAAVTSVPIMQDGAPLRINGQLAGVAMIVVHRYPIDAALNDMLGDSATRLELVGDDAPGEAPQTPPATTTGEQLTAVAEVTDSPWRVVASMPASHAVAAARGTLARQAGIAGIALLGLLIALWGLNRRVAGPLRALTAAARDTGQGAFSGRLPERGTAELAQLAREFNSMLDLRAGHEAELVHRATHDELTGLPNAGVLRDRLDALLRGDATPDGGQMLVLAIGVNRFKLLNDSLGHDVADRVLIEIGERIAAVLEPGDLLVRLGGAEFAALIERPCDGPEIAARVSRSLAEPLRGITAADVVLSAAIGISAPPAPDGSAADTSAQPPAAETLIREAISAMHYSQRHGEDWSTFKEPMRTRASAYLAMEHDLRVALDRRELTVAYQPLIDITSGRIIGAEALVRWRHPERGMVPPLEFIPIAEDTGLIVALGQQVLAEAAHQAVAWAESGHQLRMSVNVSAGQLHQEGFPESVQRVIDLAGLPPEQLCVEITESVLMRTANGDGLADLARLREIGVHLSIDDFGTGYSSLSYLHHLPVSELKIDRSFVSRLGDEHRESHLVSAIIGMGRALGLGVVAEGVETPEQLAHLDGMGCELAQGYLIAAPVPSGEFSRLLEQERDGSHMPPRAGSPMVA